jgi:urease accessory protein
MNKHVFAVLFAAILVIGGAPVLIVQPSGLASAGLASGFMLPVANLYHIVFFVSLGIFAAWLGREATSLLPLCILLMLVIGGMMEIGDRDFPAIREFIVGAIILFALGISLIRNKSFLIAILPTAIGAYVIGERYMASLPSVTSPLYFLVGSVLCAGLLIAIGVSMGITLTESIQESVEKMKKLPAITSFLSFF